MLGLAESGHWDAVQVEKIRADDEIPLRRKVVRHMEQPTSLISKNVVNEYDAAFGFSARPRDVRVEHEPSIAGHDDRVALERPRFAHPSCRLRRRKGSRWAALGLLRW